MRAQEAPANPPYVYSTFAAGLNLPFGIACDSSGNIFVGNDSAICEITPAGVVSILAGSLDSPGSTDGSGSAARFDSPTGVAVDGIGNVYVADTGNFTIRKISPTGAVSTLAGLAGARGAADGAGSAARFDDPEGIAVDGGGNVYVTDDNYGSKLRKITPAGVVSTFIVGPETSWFEGIAVDASGNIYVVDRNNLIEIVTQAGSMSIFAGSGASGSADGTGQAASFNGPHGIALDASGNVYVADTGNDTIRRITPSGVVSTIGGTPGVAGSLNGTGASAQFFAPYGVAVDSSGDVYVSDNRNKEIRIGIPQPAVALPGAIPSIGSGDVSTATTVSFSFAAPYDGGTPAAYVLQYRVSGQSAWITYGTVTWIGWQTITGLVADTPYDVQVYATNLAGSGPPSATYTVSTTAAAIALPGPIPWIGSGDVSTATTVSFNFAAPYVGGTPTAYVLQYRVTGQSAWITYGTVTWIGWQTIIGLAAGTSYDVQVYAVDSAGSGAPSAVYMVSTTGAAVALPGPIPWIGSGDVSTATTVSFNFAAPYVGGIPTAYVLQYRLTGQSAWTIYGTVTWIGWQTITGLAAGTSYEVQVYAVDSAGSGPPSAVFTVATTSD